MIYYADIKNRGVIFLYKKHCIILLCLALVLSFAGCSDAGTRNTTLESSALQSTIGSTEVTALSETSAFSTETSLDITTGTTDNGYLQKATVNGISYSLTVDLKKWEGNTSEEQIKTLEDLFWEVYPRLYERFGSISKAPTDVVLLIENDGYEVAEAWENNVHIHDCWLKDNPTDFDCFTHELAHVIQSGWEKEYLEYSSYIERFADYCRYIYAFRNGFYNDEVWDLQTVEAEPDRESSVRFLVWLDYNLSTSGNDFIFNYFRICTEKKFGTSDWDKAWAELFANTKFEGMSIDKVWDLYASSDFAALSSHTDGSGSSELLRSYDIRSRYINN